jgi:thioredoxin-like negative regulator of GroEL
MGFEARRSARRAAGLPAYNGGMAALALEGRLIVAKVNTEALPEIAAHHAVQSIPTVVLFHGGREVARAVGARPAAAIEAFIDEASQTTRPT